MSESEDFERGEFRGKVLGDLEALKAGQKLMHDCIDRIHVSLDQFKVGIGARIENHRIEITELKTRYGIMAKIMWVIGTTALTALSAAVFRLILR